MTKVTITRHHNGLTNVTDKLSLGNNEFEGNTSVTDYILPDDYEVDAANNVIRDRDGYECEIVLHSSGKPQLISRAGTISAEPVLTEA